jgi:hypothetical protein
MTGSKVCSVLMAATVFAMQRDVRAEPAHAKPEPAHIDLGTLVSQSDESWEASRKNLRVDARGINVRFKVPDAATQLTRPMLTIDAYAPGTPGARAPMSVRVLDNATGKVLGKDDSCWSGIEDHTCRISIYVEVRAIVYRVELRAPRADSPVVVQFGVIAFDPLE